MIAPILEEIAAEHPEYLIAKVNVDDEPELARDFKIMSIPALFVIRDGDVTDKVVGYRNKEALLSLLEG
jgi:thioredoxin 1